MKRYIHISLILFLGSIIFFSSCKEEKICAAYNSYFVYDATNNGYYFTSFGGEDSIPGEKSTERFNSFGLLTKSGRRNDKSLNNIDIENLKQGTIMPDTSLFGDEDDSTGSIISTKELFPERVNTDQEAYEHYVGELLKKYQRERKPPAPIDTVNEFTKPENMTPEEEKLWKQEKKERRRKEKEARKKAKEDEANKEDEDDFDFDLDF